MSKLTRRSWLVPGLGLVILSGLLVGLAVAVQRVRDAASRMSDT